MKKVLVLSREHIIPLLHFRRAVRVLGIKDVKFHYCFFFDPIECRTIINNYDLVISVHYPHILSADLVDNIRCINIHPGYNPHNKGWFPHIFSMANKDKIGVTIHEMSAQPDAGPIICREEVKAACNDTSNEVYNRILNKEFEMMHKWLKRIIDWEYELQEPTAGNYNSKSDFDDLCKLDLNHVGSFADHLDILKALSHDGMKNAYIEKDGEKYYLELKFL